MFFARADKFADAWEGSSSWFTRSVRPLLYPQLDSSARADIFNQFEALKLEMRKCTFINCWHENRHESAAMWDLYARDANGIALRTTLPRLREALASNQFSIFAGKVQYLDYAKQPVPEHNTMLPFFFKRASFVHEQEARLIVQNSAVPHVSNIPANSNGLLTYVDLTSLLEAVYVAPGSDSWIREALEATIRRFGITCAITQSNMDSDPVF